MKILILWFSSFALLFSTFFSTHAIASGHCVFPASAQPSVDRLRFLSTQLVQRMQGMGEAITMDPTKFRPDLFACEVGNAFWYFGDNDRHDYHMSRRPL